MIPTQAVDCAEPGTSTLRWRASGGIAAAVVALIHLGFSDTGRGPRIMADEAGYLANAIFLGTGDLVNMRDTAFYSGGYSLLLTPLAWWFGDDRQGLYEAVVVLHAASAAVVTLAVMWIVRQLFGATHLTTLMAGVAAGLSPAYVMHSGFSWAEATLVCLVVVAFAAVLRLLRSERGATATTELLSVGLPAGLALGAVSAVHRRMLLPAVVVLVVLAAWSMFERRARVVVGTALVFAMVVVAAGILDAHLLRHVWSGSAAELDLGEKVTGLGTWSGATSTAAAATGQIWYLLVATAGLAVAAVAACIERLHQPVRLRHRPDWQGWFCLALLGSLASLVAVSAIFVGSATTNAEYLFYGRYPELLAPLLIGVGFAWVATASRRAITWCLVAVAVLGTGSWAVVALLNGDRLEQSLNRVTVAGVIDWVLPDEDLLPLLRGTLVAIAAFALIAAIAWPSAMRTRPITRCALVAVVVAAVWSWNLVAIREHIVVPLRSNAEGYVRLEPAIRATGSSRLGLDTTWGRGPRVALSLRLPGVVVDTDDGSQCWLLVSAAGAEQYGTVRQVIDAAALVERSGSCRG